MNTIKQTQHVFNILKRQVLIVIFICYSPHIASEPLWLSILFFAVIGYQSISDHFNYPAMPRWLRFVIFIGCLFILYGDMFSSGFFVRCLLTFIILKFLEMRSVRDLKVIIISNFLLIFSALIIVQDPWIIIYLFIAVLANLSVMLKLSAPESSLRQIGGKSSQQLLIAVPLSILLFYFFPRVAPLWNIPSFSKSSTGFSETMCPGSVSQLFNDTSTAMQISFKKNPKFNVYWRGLILSFYNGESWSSSSYNDAIFFPLHGVKVDETADYEIILEPHLKKWLFYAGNPIAGDPNLLYSPNHGMMRQNKEPITQRFDYSLKVQSVPYHPLGSIAYEQATQLPKNSNPRLNTWAKNQFAKTHKNVRAFISFLQDYINQQPFWYTLTPPVLDSNENQMDSFWFDTQKGFCEHYAGAVTFILRSAGIPARVVLGYLGGEWNPISNTLTIQQSDAHAWLEYWQEGVGWEQFDPTSFVANIRIDQTIQSREMDLNKENNSTIFELSLGRKASFFFESVRFSYERWFLFYNQNTQENLLQHVGLGKWKKEDLLQASVGCMILFFILLELSYQWWQKRTLDALLVEYHLLQKEFRKFNISTGPSATLKKQCKALMKKVPALEPMLTSFMQRYEQLRLKQSKMDVKENKKETLALFKTLRRTLRQRKSY